MEPLLSGAARTGRRSAILPYVRGRVLDLGCGWTDLPDRLPGIDRYVGVDNVPDAVTFSSRRYPEHTFLLGDLDHGVDGLEALGEAGFDTIVLAALLEHLHQPARVLERARAWLAPDGRLVVTTPTTWGDLVHRVGSRMGLFYSETTVAHVHIFGRGELRALMRECGYEVVTCRTFAWGANHLVVCRAASRGS